MQVSNADDFRLLDKVGKVEYITTEIENAPSVFSDKGLYQFLKSIILDTSEDNFIRKRALSSFINFVLLGQLQTRQGLSVLIDDWVGKNDLHLELERCKSLFLFYCYAPKDVEGDLKNYLNSKERELVAESLYYLGLIEFQKAFETENIEGFQEYLTHSKEYFYKSNNEIENRIDAQIFLRITSILIDLSNEKQGGLDFYFRSLAKLLFEKESNSFKSSKPFYIRLYRTLVNLRNIRNEEPDSWINFKEDLDKTYVNYCEIINSRLKDRLNESYLNSLFVTKLKREFVQPFFKLNFIGEKKRIETLINREEISQGKKQFLLELKDTLDDSGLKKKNNLSLYGKNF